MPTLSMFKWMRHDVFSAWWVDDGGAIRPAVRHVSEFDSFAYRKFGLVKILIGQHGFEISWDVQKVNDDVLDRTALWLFSTQDNIQVKLTYYYFGWFSETVDKDKALSRLSAIRSYRHINMNKSVFMHKHDLSNIPCTDNLFQRSLAAWNNSQNQFHHSELLQLRRDYIIFTPHESEPIFEYSHVGTNAPMARVMGTQWRKSAIGAIRGSSGITESYRNIANRPYEEVMATGEARYDKILATIQPPNGDPIWTSYHRLLLPGRDLRGRPNLICASVFHDVNFQLLEVGQQDDAYLLPPSKQAIFG